MQTSAVILGSRPSRELGALGAALGLGALERAEFSTANSARLRLSLLAHSLETLLLSLPRTLTVWRWAVTAPPPKPSLRCPRPPACMRD